MNFFWSKMVMNFFWSKMIMNFFLVKNDHNFFWSKMVINEPKMFINFFWRYAMGKMSINKPLSGLG